MMLVTCVVGMTDVLHIPMEVGLKGASLPIDGGGGYVLAAVLAFFAGVIVTAAILRYRK
jgi:hypothetical protein